MNAPNRRKAESAARRFANRWEPVYPRLSPPRATI